MDRRTDVLVVFVLPVLGNSTQPDTTEDIAWFQTDRALFLLCCTRDTEIGKCRPQPYWELSYHNSRRTLCTSEEILRVVMLLFYIQKMPSSSLGLDPRSWIFSWFCWLHPEDCQDGAWKQRNTASVHVIILPAFINHRTIRHHILWATETAIKWVNKIGSLHIT
jgi:hypothetical protein